MTYPSANESIAYTVCKIFTLLTINMYDGHKCQTHSKRYNGLVDRYEKAKTRFDEVTEAIAQRSTKGERLRREASPFRERGSSGHLRRRRGLWRSLMSSCGGAMVDYVTVGVDGGMTVVFREGAYLAGHSFFCFT